MLVQSREEQATTDTGRHAITVLIVDDEGPVLHLVERVLDRAGYVTATASSGAEAIRVASALASLDVLVTDLMMPRMSGDELAHELRRRHQGLRVLYVTGGGHHALEGKLTPWAPEACLDKPFSSRGLLDAVALLSSRDQAL
jgi:CheY-like chemotaxis protein